ncbi:MAG: hypothetical protein II715_00360, partial [Clostridia bacterium]|nr:hypothetical protein [Clostridia bacterium]
DWSGQPEGLTFQRSVRALENYGHYAELTRVAEKLFAGVGPEALFTQQFDPFTAKPSMENNPGDYGPTLLACLEYMSRLYGVNRSRDTVSWGAFAKDGRTYDYTQSYGDRTYRIVSDSKTACGTVDGKPVFTVTCGCRVETDTEGRLLRVIGMDRTAKDVTVTAGRVRRTARIAPNAVLDMTDAGSVPDERVPYLGD